MNDDTLSGETTAFVHEILGGCFQSGRVQAGDACAQKMRSAAASKIIPYVYKSNKGSLLQSLEQICEYCGTDQILEVGPV